MASYQTQYHCLRCQRHTLHTCETRDVPHVLYLLLSVFCCFPIWVPVWLIHVIVNSLSASEPYRCTVCGQSAGQLTPEQETARRAGIARDKAERRAAAAQNRAAAKERFRDWLASLKPAWNAAWAQIQALPRRVDVILKTLAGEGNEIIHWFLRVVAVAATLTLLVALAWEVVVAAIAWVHPK